MAKRLYRQLDDTTKNKISKALVGKKKSEHTKRLISRKMTEYWKTIKDRPQQLSMDEYLKDE